jgi:hypothetical protein
MLRIAGAIVAPFTIGCEACEKSMLILGESGQKMLSKSN